MMSNWLEREDAVERVCEIAAVIDGRDQNAQTDDSERMLAGLLIDEMIDWCGLELVPEGALWATAEELLRRQNAQTGGTVAQVSMGNFSVQYQDGAQQRWHNTLRPWRRIRW